MKKKKFIFMIALLLIIENVVLWYVADFYYQYTTHQIRVDSREGQAEVCKAIPLSDELFSVLEKMHKYHPNVYLDSSDRFTLNYGSEWSKGFATGVSVAFIFDKNYK